jgi:oligopeptide/dipeptide ABC transporter ATP-binding protein
VSKDADTALVNAQDLRKSFTRERSQGGMDRVIDQISLRIHRGEIVGLVGESGSGKSTLGRMILGLVPPTEGWVRYDGVDIWSLSAAARCSMRAKAQMVFQDPLGALNPRRTIAENIELPLINFGWPGRERRRRVEDVLLQVGLNPAHTGRFPHQFSGGQCQRAVIARAIALKPEFLFLDEPVSALDVSVQAQILNLLADLRRSAHLTYLFVSHDLRVVRHLCDRTAVLYHGQLVELAASQDIYDRPLHPYTRALRMAVLDDSANADVAPSANTDPKATATHAGCRYAAQCPLRREVCLRERPPLLEWASGRWIACHATADIAPWPLGSKTTERGIGEERHEHEN